MGAGAFIEPLVVVILLLGGTWVNRDTECRLFGQQTVYHNSPRSGSADSGRSSPSSSASLLANVDDESKWRKREIMVLGMKKGVMSPNTRRFQDYFLSRVLRKFPFLVEAWYWALIYWVYQLGRAISALTMASSTITIARRHALQLIHLEQRLHLFFELDVQAWFLRHPFLLHWTNRTYSFIHIPGTILFLVWLFYDTTTRDLSILHNKPADAGVNLYAARRRTMATCNLLAFIIFTLWPCMPPRLLSDPSVPDTEARSYGFVDTVHSAAGESSVWTQNKFCNQYAAMPSLHFGYSLLIGITVMSIPLSSRYKQGRRVSVTRGIRLRVPCSRRCVCVALGIAYPAIILVVIVATANHFLLDAVAGAVVCGLAWMGNGVLLNLLVVEDYFLWCVRIHKPERRAVCWEGGDDVEFGRASGGEKGLVID